MGRRRSSSSRGGGGLGRGLLGLQHDSNLARAQDPLLHRDEHAFVALDMEERQHKTSTRTRTQMLRRRLITQRCPGAVHSSCLFVSCVVVLAVAFFPPLLSPSKSLARRQPRRRVRAHVLVPDARGAGLGLHGQPQLEPCSLRAQFVDAHGSVSKVSSRGRRVLDSFARVAPLRAPAVPVVGGLFGHHKQGAQGAHLLLSEPARAPSHRLRAHHQPLAVPRAGQSHAVPASAGAHRRHEGVRSRRAHVGAPSEDRPRTLLARVLRRERNQDRRDGAGGLQVRGGGVAGGGGRWSARRSGGRRRRCAARLLGSHPRSSGVLQQLLPSRRQLSSRGVVLVREPCAIRLRRPGLPSLPGVRVPLSRALQTQHVDGTHLQGVLRQGESARQDTLGAPRCRGDSRLQLRGHPQQDHTCRQSQKPARQPQKLWNHTG